MKKMCKWDRKCVYADEYGFVRFHVCPKNTNSKCEIISPKPKYKRIKAWARWRIDGEMFAVTDKYEDNTIPCTILIEAKYLKGRK